MPGVTLCHHTLVATGIVVVCPNLSLDRTIETPEIRIGGVHRSDASETRGGGKGANVARALNCAGTPCTLTGLIGGYAGEAIRALLEEEGITTDLTSFPGESRSCLTVLAGGTVTSFNEAGADVGKDAWLDFEHKIAALVEPGGVLVCSGSFPPDVPPEAVTRIVSLAKKRNCTAILDTSREHLRASVRAGAALVTPNVVEALTVLENEGPEEADTSVRHPGVLADVGRRLLQAGAGAVLVTAGAGGAALTGPFGTVFASAPAVSVRNPIGAGDVLVGGLAMGVAKGMDIVRALPMAIAMAAASCETFPAGLLHYDRAMQLLGEVETSR